MSNTVENPMILPQWELVIDRIDDDDPAIEPEWGK